MLQKAFFKVDVVDRIYDTPVFEKTTPGAYEFTVPEEYNYVVIEYAGARSGTAGSTGGKGSVLKTDKIKIQTRNISGIIGQHGENRGAGGSSVPQPSIGYNTGEIGSYTYTQLGYVSGGTGGGSSSVVLNNIVYEACGGGGANYNGYYGGKGGGQYGGARQTTKNAAGNNATDPNRIGYNDGEDGYVKIWAGYDPYLKG